jgi:uncharacterized delta-60 repeat protein
VNVHRLLETLEGRQLLSGGLPDPSFGSGGKVLTQFLGSRVDEAADVAVQSDGKFIVAGTSTDRTEDDFALARYNPDGTLDATFGDKGLVRTDINLDDRINDIAIQSDGRILATGFSSSVATDGSLKYAFVVARYNANGSLDGTFGDHGVVTEQVGVYGSGQRVLVLADGRIVVGGSTAASLPGATDFALMRFTPSGALDPTFGTGGIVISDIGGAADSPRDFVLMGDKVLAVGDTLAGPTSTNVLMARYDSAGKLDGTFGAGGTAVIPAGSGVHVGAAGLTASGNIVVAGNDASAFSVWRFTPTGKVDATFGAAGVVRKDVTLSDQGQRLIVQADGKLLVGGTVSTSGTIDGGDYALLRFNANGTSDGAFGQGGVSVTVRPGAQGLNGLALRADGSILVAGGDDVAKGNFEVMRYTPAGAVDKLFGRAGVVSTDFQSAFGSKAADVAVQADGKLVVVGTADNGGLLGQNVVAIARYLPSGGLDNSFGVGGRLMLGAGEPTRVFVRPDGRIIVAVIGTDQRTRFMQFNANGTTDTSFGVNGVADPNVFAERGGANIVRMTDGRLLIAGVTGNAGPSSLAVVRMTADGKFDVNFGNGGVATADVGDFTPYSIAVAPSGRIVVGGANLPTRTQPFTTQLALVQFLTIGALDTSFGNGGEVIVTSGPASNEADAIAIQSDGAIVVASGDGAGMLLSRFNGAGKADLTFGVSGGLTKLSIPVSRLLIEPYDGILAGGVVSPDALAVARFNSAGRPDTAFGTSGVAKIAVPSFAIAGGLTLDDSNRIVVAGTGGQQFAVARFTSDNQSPFAGERIALPGLIEAENFDRGMEGVSYHDTTAANAGGVFRETGVDVDKATDSGGGYFVRSTQAGEWLEYSVDVKASGAYDLDVRVASLGAGGTFSISVDGKDVTGPITVPDTGGWQNWRTITKTGVPLHVGQAMVKLNMLTIGRSGITGNFNWLRLTPGAAKPGLAATFYDTQDLTGLGIPANVGNVNFNWGSGSPLPSIAPDTFSARFEGFLQVPESGEYTLYTRADDGVRLWLDDRILINDWQRHPATERSVTLQLLAGRKYALKLEYFEAYGSASVALSWSSATIAKQIVPGSALSTV